MATYALRNIQNLSRLLDAGKKTLASTLRCASTIPQNRIKTGPNGEKIIISPFPDVTYPETLLHEFVWSNSENYPNHIALECGVNGKKYTYAQAKDATSYIGRSLRNIGLKTNDVIAIIAPNLPDAILGLLGSSSGGFIATTMNPVFTAEEISRQMLKANVKAVITSTVIAPTALAATKACLPPGTPFIVIDDKTGPIPEGSIPFDDLITRGKSLSPVKLDATCDDIVVLPFSSGTTGLPKGVMLTHRNLISNIVMTHSSTLNFFQPTSDTFQDVIPLILPFFHIYGMNSVTYPRLHFGSKIVTIPKFVPETFLNVMEKSKATSLFVVPPIVIFLSNSPLVKKKHLEHLHLIMSGAAPLAKSDADKLIDKFNIDTNVTKVCQGYGLTESAPVAFIEREMKYSSIGKNIASCEVRLVDIATQQDICTPHQSGELLVRGPHVMKGYLNDDASTKATLTEDNWLKTGDLAYFDEDLDFYIADRMKELIKVKGFQVPPAELEALLRTHPDVMEAAVIGIPHARDGEVPRAFVVAKKDKKPTEDDIKNFIKGKVSEYKELKGGVAFVNEIPKSTTGKILRSKLKSEFKS
ncbi:4-coumarate--CoA ligase 1-like [Pseudomyrmex gracilis]|uniref:4-coumarate--CoA ligase 1-like n=1 Tax=Pseudomyrmex gracilis TaxID=219809 RepID=UPI0009952120|nr:4-coumarate--CoA ligase 1-like [Pseudomyrmex gracilis]XP_020279536.1 4-coumarate--CoA ligase 1-like [Pseudomyrmex gracilis]XP_020279537.1 4-coumarate--CoA ligase 1-like [Pseudomyrmex gracilis]XP_020279538.1 4-coumarate--CoA ligase 1-like [Pseudomyrmex gracilis]XP_020279539.1 4-coumarate--CoA ligase 1-like [Pseudomyrmex gracilis]